MLQHAQVRADDEPDRRQQERDAERRAHHLLDLLPLSQRPGDQHPAEGAGDRADAEPLHQAQVHRAAAKVHERADRLHHRARDEVRGHGGERRHVEEQHQHRRHERATAHPGESHDDPDAERRQRE
jgi:hypothetical protein